VLTSHDGYQRMVDMVMHHALQMNQTVVSVSMVIAVIQGLVNFMIICWSVIDVTLFSDSQYHTKKAIRLLQKKTFIEKIRNNFTRKYATIYKKIRNNLQENTQQLYYKKIRNNFTRKYATIYEKIRNNFTRKYATILRENTQQLYCGKIRNNLRENTQQLYCEKIYIKGYRRLVW
jgi:hypothetical protein